MSSVRLPVNIPSLEDESHAPTDLSSRFGPFVRNGKRKENMNGNLLKWL